VSASDDYVDAHLIGCDRAGAHLSWKNISLGSYQTVGALRDALKARDILIGDLADQMLAQPSFDVSSTVTSIDLMILTVAQLGLGPSSFMTIHAHATKMGLDLCPPEVGPQLRLQYLAQKVGEYLVIGMKPLLTARGIEVCFVVGNGGAGLLLIGRLAASDLSVSPRSRFVFARRR
jgi:hypothetical protein